MESQYHNFTLLSHLELIQSIVHNRTTNKTHVGLLSLTTVLIERWSAAWERKNCVLFQIWTIISAFTPSYHPKERKAGKNRAECLVPRIYGMGRWCPGNCTCGITAGVMVTIRRVIVAVWAGAGLGLGWGWAGAGTAVTHVEHLQPAPPQPSHSPPAPTPPHTGAVLSTHWSSNSTSRSSTSREKKVLSPIFHCEIFIYSHRNLQKICWKACIQEQIDFEVYRLLQAD